MALGGGHGGTFGLWEGVHGRERESSQREREEGEDISWRRWASPGELLGGLGGKQEVATAGNWEPPRRCFMKKTKEYFQKAPLASGFSLEF
jgi:hypothetical protein